MELGSVRALKAELAERVVGPLIAETRARQSLDVAACSLDRVTGVEAGVALGIAAGSGPGDYCLAVRLQRRALEALQQLRESIEAACRREADFRYIGRVAKDAEALPAAALPWHQVRQRPLLIGVSIGHYRVTAGTLGAFVRHRATGRPGILSNNHVLANENSATRGDPILQPGSYDGGHTERDRIATLLDFVPLDSRSPNRVDAAFAALDEGIGFDATSVTGLGRLNGLRTSLVEPGTQVAKAGRTTGLTRGRVTAIELDSVVVNFEQGDLAFEGQIEIEGTGGEAFSSGGDSGSLILDEDGLGCALLFAGSDQGGSNGKGLTYANELTAVLDLLDLELALDAVVS